ncbi:MAG: DUF2723 domain-containing protein [Rubrobacter sp.]|nr:DUF2723 domain-containing protein [Rubrobacter sp.]
MSKEKTGNGWGVGSKQEGARKMWTVISGCGVALFVFVLYLMTVAPTILPLDRAFPDSAMLQMQAAVLGITHPTGYPTYLTLAHLFTYLPVGDVAYRVNLASAVFGALSVLAVYAAGYLFTRRIVPSAAGALTFGLGAALWSQAVIAEVYTLNALLISLTLLALLRWKSVRTDRYLLLAAFGAGLCVTNHMTSALILPAGLIFVGLVEWRKLVEWRLVLKGFSVFLLGITPYLYLPIRAAMNAPFEGNNPTSLGRFWYVVSGGNLTGTFFAFGPAEAPERLAFYWGHLMQNFNPFLLMVSLTGAAILISRDKAVAALTGFLFLGWLVHALENDIPDVMLYFIPTYLILCLWMAMGLEGLMDAFEDVAGLLRGRWRGIIPSVLSLAILLLPLVGVQNTYATNDMSENYEGRRVIEAVAKSTAPNSTVLHHRDSLWYMVLVEKRRWDLTLVDPFWHNRDIHYADLVWPGHDDLPTTDRIYGTDDFSGVTAARKAIEKGPVYIVDQGIVGPKGFKEAGFDVVRIRASILYELVPGKDGLHAVGDTDGEVD